MSSRLYEAPEIKEAKRTEMRVKFFKESKFDPHKQKYGLFSFSGSLAISEDTYSRPKTVKRNEDGTVATQARNFYTSPTKKGEIGGAYFQTPLGRASIGGQYPNTQNRYTGDKMRSIKMRQIHEQPFRVKAKYQEPYTSYQHTTELNEKQRISRRDAEGNVTIGPRNFYTSPGKKRNPACVPGEGFSKPPEYIPDPYDRKRELDRANIKKQAARIEVPFKPSSPGGKTFVQDKDTYASVRMPPKSATPAPRISIYPHERPFVRTSPPKRDIVNKSIGKFPEYVPNPEKISVRKSLPEAVPWKRSYLRSSSPVESVIAMKSNLRALSPELRKMR